MDVEAEYWRNPEDVKIACYKWLPESQPKFIVYLGKSTLFSSKLKTLKSLISEFVIVCCCEKSTVRFIKNENYPSLK